MKAEDERDIAGLVVIVTGANSGIGKEAAYEFAVRKATVIMACRNLTEGNKAIDDHRKRALEQGCSTPLDLSLMHLDLMDFSSVRKFCDQVKSEYGTVDILVNNAGIFDTSGKLRRTEGGTEQHLVVNYLSQFLLTHLLLDTMKGGNPKNGRTKSPSRIIDVSSTLELFGILAEEDNIMLEKPPKTMGFVNSFPYGLSKYYTCLSCRELSRRTDPTDILIYSMCPGYADTGMFRSFSRCRKMAADIAIFLVGISPAESCDTILSLALSKIPPETGLFYRFQEPYTPINKRIEEGKDFGIKLWDLSETLVGGLK